MEPVGTDVEQRVDCIHVSPCKIPGHSESGIVGVQVGDVGLADEWDLV